MEAKLWPMQEEGSILLDNLEKGVKSTIVRAVLFECEFIQNRTGADSKIVSYAGGPR